MKVLNLRCANGHDFEGWFASDDDFMDQNGRRLIECPLCSDSVVTRLPSAPRLNLSGAREALAVSDPSNTTEKPASSLPVAAPQPSGVPADMQAAWIQTVRHLMAHTEDVGPRFATEARRMHYGETETRAIRGQASPQEREALLDEGIETVAIPVPAALKGPMQ
jgi:hypothetical protein